MNSLNSNDCTRFCKELPREKRPNFLPLVGLFLTCALWSGCSQLPARVHLPSIDHAEVTEWTFSRCDQDKDGSISEEESDVVPALKRRFSLFDENKDKKVSTEEFQEHLIEIFDSRGALLGASSIVYMGGKPLEGATVRLEPLEVLSGVLPPVEGVTDAEGKTELGMTREELPSSVAVYEPLVRPGLYRAIITHPTIKIPAKYNAETILGEELSLESLMGGAIRFALDKN